MTNCSKCGELLEEDVEVCPKCKAKNNNNDGLSDLLLIGNDHTVTDLLLVNSLYNNIAHTASPDIQSIPCPSANTEVLSVIDQQPMLTGPIDIDNDVPTGNGECCDIFEDGCDCDCCDGCDCDCGGCDCDCGGCDDCVIL